MISMVTVDKQSNIKFSLSCSVYMKTNVSINFIVVTPLLVTLLKCECKATLIFGGSLLVAKAGCSYSLEWTTGFTLTSKLWKREHLGYTSSA